MSTYEIIYDYCSEDGMFEERNCIEIFSGDWPELQEHLNAMRKSGTCYNIDAACISDE